MPITLARLHNKITICMCILVTKPVVLDFKYCHVKQARLQLGTRNIFNLHDQVINFLNEEKVLDVQMI